jgi:hypothetical protein
VSDIDGPPAHRRFDEFAAHSIQYAKMLAAPIVDLDLAM